MKDFFGQQLEIGDSVGVLLKGYRHLVNAKVIQFTPQKVRVEYKQREHLYSETYLVDTNMLVRNPSI